MKLTETDFLQMEKRYRASFFNSLGGFKSVALVGTINAQKQTNLAIFNSVMHIGASPPMCSILIRPAEVERHTYENILSQKHFTINHINQAFYKKAHQTSARYERNVSEFNAVGLTEEYSQNIIAPYVKESCLKFGLEWAQTIEIPINNTILVIGSIKEVFVDEQFVMADGFIDLEAAGSITVSGLDSYHSTQKISRLPYAKPNEDLREI
jgi:flavin reductase (DIM6/NTAB) family NADH-FMN oxidoreductase RutF